MSATIAPNMITDGLIFYLDAANTKSYVGTGTSWNDISGFERNGTLTNGPTFSNSNSGTITLDGTNDFVSIVSFSLVITGGTFITWIRRNGTQVDYSGLLYNRVSLGTGLSVETSNRIGYSWNNESNTWGWNTNLTIPDLQLCMCAISVNSTSAVAYICQSSGISSATNSVSHGSATLETLRVGYDGLSNRYFKGNVSQGLIYNRDLSSTEIEQIFRTTKGRYGL